MTGYFAKLNIYHLCPMISIQVSFERLSIFKTSSLDKPYVIISKIAAPVGKTVTQIWAQMENRVVSLGLAESNFPQIFVIPFRCYNYYSKKRTGPELPGQSTRRLLYIKTQFGPSQTHSPLLLASVKKKKVLPLPISKQRQAITRLSVEYRKNKIH